MGSKWTAGWGFVAVVEVVGDMASTMASRRSTAMESEPSGDPTSQACDRLEKAVVALQAMTVLTGAILRITDIAAEGNAQK